MGQNSAVLMCSLRVCENICDPPLSVYKVHSMRKDTAEYLASRGLKGAAFTIRAADLKDDLFGTLFPCPVEISVEGDSSSTLLPPKRPLEDAGTHSAKSCKLEFDGGSKENPGQAGAGAILRADDGSMICRLRQGLGTSTNRSAKKFLASSPAKETSVPQLSRQQWDQLLALIKQPTREKENVESKVYTAGPNLQEYPADW